MRKYSIITVENDEDEQFFMKEGFDKTGHFELLAQLSNGQELQDWFKENPGVYPDVILSDLNMPGKNGYDILTAINEDPLLAHIPVIITSTSYTKSIIDKCFANGAADYIVKPDTFIEYAPFIINLHRIIVEKQLVK
jgi:CheY-like chemotaxis protein